MASSSSSSSQSSKAAAMEEEVLSAREELAGLREHQTALENSAAVKKKRFDDQRAAYEEVLAQRQALARDYITTSVSMGFLDEKAAQAKLNEVAGGGSHKGLPKPLADYFIVCTREDEAHKLFEEVKGAHEEAADVLRHARADTQRAADRVELLEQQLNASSKKARATAATVLADSEVQASKALPPYALVRAHGQLHPDPAINELKFLLEQLILRQEQTMALVRQEKDAAVAAAQREKDAAIAALRKERDSALTTLMNAQLQLEEVRSSNNPYAKIASGGGGGGVATGSSTRGGGGGASHHGHGHGHGHDNLLSVSYLTHAAIDSFAKPAGPPVGVVRALHDFDLWPAIRRDIAEFILRNTGAAAYNSAGHFVGKPVHPWLRNRAAELGITVEFQVPADHPGSANGSGDGGPLQSSSSSNNNNNSYGPASGAGTGAGASGAPAPALLPEAHFDGGDGIIHAIATKFGRAAWRNPAEDGELVVRRSSDGLYSEPPSVLVGPHGAYCFTADEPNQWFCVDFGPKRLVWPTAYSLRHGYSSSTHFLRDWVLEGSLAGGDSDVEWHVVANHVNDKHLSNTGYAAHTWKVHRPCPAAGFRYLRVRQTGRNSSTSQDLYLSGFEVYGKFLNSLKKIKVAVPEGVKGSKAGSTSKKKAGGGNHKGRHRGGAADSGSAVGGGKFLPAV